jgi:hypothetical protein
MKPDMTGTGRPQGVGERGIAADGDRRQLGERLFRILPGGAGKPDRLGGLYDGTVEDDAGGDDAPGVFGFFGVLAWRKPDMEPAIGFALIAVGASFIFRG